MKRFVFIFTLLLTLATYSNAGATYEAICHQTGNGGYVLIEHIHYSGIINGHIDHQDVGDIIPPFDYEGHHYEQNWNEEHIVIFSNGCSTPEPTATSTDIPTSTATSTATETSTATATDTETETSTATATETATETATNTVTSTAVSTATEESTPTCDGEFTEANCETPSTSTPSVTPGATESDETPTKVSEPSKTPSVQPEPSVTHTDSTPKPNIFVNQTPTPVASTNVTDLPTTGSGPSQSNNYAAYAIIGLLCLAFGIRLKTA